MSGGAASGRVGVQGNYGVGALMEGGDRVFDVAGAPNL